MYLTMQSTSGDPQADAEMDTICFIFMFPP